jgi:hypothetical protein
MEAFATMSSVESFASMESAVRARRYLTAAVLTGEEATLVGMARTVVGAVIEVIIVVSFVMLAVPAVSPIARVLPTIVPPVGKVLPVTVVPIAKVTKVSIKIMLSVSEEENRRKAHVKR